MMPKPLLLKALLTVILFLFIFSNAQSQCLEGDCQDGRGIFLFPGGSKYIGEWKNGQMNGMGEFISSSGARYSGEWRDGSLWQYIYPSENQSASSSVSGDQKEEAEGIVKDIEKRMSEERFDPSTDLPAPAAGPTPGENE